MVQMPRLGGLALVAMLLALGFIGVGMSIGAADVAVAAAKKACKKTQQLRKGKCVAKKKAKAKAKPPKASPAPDMSDADGDAIPYAWEVPPPPTSSDDGRCRSNQQLRKGKCVPRCKKGRTLKRGKCVPRKKPGKRRKKAGARASIAPTSVAMLGASPNHKDIFVQVNYASEGLRQSASCSELDAIVAAFASAPVSNPDGRTGIDLHIDAGISCPSRSYDLGGSAIFSAGGCPNFTAVFNASELPESRVGTFHVAGFAPTCGMTGAAGVANQNGIEMVVFTDGPSFAHVLMHELGHNLGLDHGAFGQPNRLSTMSSVLAVSDTGSGFDEILDYQRISLPALDEDNLSEEAGISAPPEAHRFYIQHFCAGDNPPNGGYRSAWPGDGSIDWNCNSSSLLPPGVPPTIDPGTVPADVNGDGQLTVLPATGPEWPTLNYASGGQIGPR
jgi:hypothetical protein